MNWVLSNSRSFNRPVASATVHPCRTSECVARSEPEMGASRNPAIRPGGKDSWPRLGQRSASTSIACRKRCSQAHPFRLVLQQQKAGSREALSNGVPGEPIPDC